MTLQTISSARPSRLYYGIVFVFLLVVLFLASQMIIMGLRGIPILIIALASLLAYILLASRAYVWRFLIPGILGMALFVLLPLVYTVWVGFTNYSSAHLLTKQRVQAYFASEKMQNSEARFNYSLYQLDTNQYQLVLASEPQLVSEVFALQNAAQTLSAGVQLVLQTSGDPLTLRDIVPLRAQLALITIELEQGDSLIADGLRHFAAVSPRYDINQDGSLYDRQLDQTLTADDTTGFYRNAEGEKIGPGYRVAIGWQNYVRVFTHDSFRGPLLKIFLWNVTFAALSVLFTLIVGMALGTLMNWPELQGKGLYKTLLFLPYAVPGFIAILVFKGLFNNSFGEINLILNSLFGIRPQWFSDPFLAKCMILMVNTWLGYPYIMLISMGLLKSIPAEYFEASAIDGANLWQKFRYITAPLLIKPMLPLLISSFAFNFNNFVLIALLTAGRPDFLNSQTPAGTTDILVSYTYRIAFEDSGQNFGLASAISTLIFCLVGLIAYIQLKITQRAR